jgi:hypothetical protein
MLRTGMGKKNPTHGDAGVGSWNDGSNGSRSRIVFGQSVFSW